MSGISVYLSKENQIFNHQWIKMAAKNGFSSIFTSLQIPEEDPKVYKELLIDLGNQAQESSMSVFADISKKSLEHLGIDIDNVEKLKEFGVTGLRIDYGFSEEEIVKLSHKIKISLNASTLNEIIIKNLVEAGLNTDNVEACHNYYPRPETGLSKGYLIKKNIMLKSFNLKISSFIPGNGKKRQPLFKGLPTLERHRFISPVEAYLDLIDNCYVDKVYIGDQSLDEDTLERFSLINENIVPIRYMGEKIPEFEDLYNYLDQLLRNRPDSARDVIRIDNSRIDLHNYYYLKQNNAIERKKGSITIDNEDYQRYAGEIHITLTDLQMDHKVNVIGHVIEQDLPLLDYIREGRQFILKKIN
jgi:hypothetical protein